jgi:hypothetical protein
MSNEDFRSNSKSSDAQQGNQPGNGSSRFEDVKEQEQQAQYNKHYQLIAPLLDKGCLDFKLIARETGLKERKIRDTLLSRLTTGDMIQLFGYKEGICYICGTRMRGNFTQEPLCLLCVEVIGSKIKDLYPPEVQETLPLPSREISPREEGIPGVSKEQFEALLSEVHRYRDKYGPIEPPVEEPPLLTIRHEPACSAEEQETETAEEAESAETTQDAPSCDVFELLHIDENSEEAVGAQEKMPSATQSASGEPIRHFGFQRLKSRN